MPNVRTNFAPTDPAMTHHVLALREALLAVEAVVRVEGPVAPQIERLQRRVDTASAPLIERFYESLLRYCDHLVRSTAALRDHSDGEDIAQDAWMKALRYLKAESGARVQNDVHFLRILRLSALRRFLDLRQEATTSMDESSLIPERRLVAPAQDSFSILETAGASELTALLFGDEAAFRRRCRRPVRRRLNHYRAFAAYELGHFVWCEMIEARTTDVSGKDSGFVVTLMRQYADAVGIPPDDWLAIESILTDAENLGQPAAPIEDRLIEVVNQLYDAAIRPGNILSVLRHEFGGFLNG